MARTISAANIAIGFDASKLKAGVDLSKKEITDLSKIINASLSPVERYTEGIRLLTTGIFRGAVESERFKAASLALAKAVGHETEEMKAARLAAEAKAKADKDAIKASKDAADAAIRRKKAEESYDLGRSNWLRQQRLKQERDADAAAARRKKAEESYDLGRSKWLREQRLKQEREQAALQQKTNSLLRESETLHERVARKMAFLRQQLQANKITQDQYNKALAHNLSLLNATKGGAGGGGLGGFFAQSGGSIRNIALTYLGFGAMQRTLGQSFALASEVEQAKIALDVLTGSASKANRMLGELKDLAGNSQLSFPNLLKASKTMLGFGAETWRVIPVLKQLSDISMGDADRFAHLSLAMSQVAAAGKLMGQEVIQMVNAGFNPLLEISNKTGKPLYVLRKEMEQGAISAEMVYEALEAATSAGGRFFGMTERMAGTAAGHWAKLRAEYQKVGVEIGEKLIPNMKSLSETLGKQAPQIGKTAGGFIGFWADVADLLLQPSDTNVFDYLQERDRMRVAAAEEEKIAARFEVLQREATERQNEADRDKIKADNERKNYEARAAHIHDAIKAEEEARKKAQLSEVEFFEWKLRQELITADLTAAYKAKVEKDIWRAVMDFRRNKSAEAAAEALKEAEKAAEKLAETNAKLKETEQKKLEDRLKRWDPVKDAEDKLKDQEGNLSRFIAPLIESGSVEYFKRETEARAADRRMAQKNLLINDAIRKLTQEEVNILKKLNVPIPVR